MAPAGKQNGPASAVDFTEAGIRTRLRQQIQAAVQSIQWTYSVFWQFSPQQGLLEWADGFYNGVIKTRKTVQPMELSPEDLSAQRSLQLRELFESLSAGETNPPTKRPCAALSPEDLTESEWFYLMCMSFTFAPGVGLPGRALAKRHHVWLSQASDADSKLFTRAILAKSARIQTVLCIPLVDGVLEMGSTDMIREDVGLVQHVKNMMVDHSKPACSEQSTSNPPSSGNLARVLSEDQPIVQPPAPVVFEEQNAKTKELSESGYENPHIGVQVCGLQSEKTVTEFGQHESEIMELDMSPEDCSNDNDIASDVALPGANTSMAPKSSLQAWSDVSHGLHSSGPHRTHEEANEEDSAHYSKTVSFVLQQKGQSQWTESSPTLHLGSMSDDHLPQQTAFSPWTPNAQQNKPNPNPQWMLKYILLTVSGLHSKDSRDHENSPRVDARDGDNSACRPRKNGQDDLTVNHVLAERRRREKLNEKFIILRTLVPFVTKMDKASILGDAIEYVKQLRRRIQELEARSKQMEIELKGARNASPTQLAGRKHFNNKSHEKLTRQASSVGNHNNNQVDPEVVSSCRNSSDIDQSKVASRLIEKRKIRVLEGFEPLKIVEGCSADIQVSIIEREALVELQCPWRDGLLLDVMQTINSLRLEAYSVQSSMLNQTFVAKIRAKVREAPIGLKPTITEVKTAIQSCIPIPS